MDYLVHQTPEELDSTCYIEIGPGLYSGKHWQPGFSFVSDEAFAFAQGVVSYHFPAYDPYGTNELPAAIAFAIALDLKEAETSLSAVGSAMGALRLEQCRTAFFCSELRSKHEEIARMLGGVAAALERSAQEQEWVCILGM